MCSTTNFKFTFTTLIIVGTFVAGALSDDNTDISFEARARRHLRLHDTYDASWIVVNDTITFTLTVRTLGFIGFGISKNGGMTGADIISVGIHSNGTVYIEDRHGEGNREPKMDASQDYHLISGSENDTHTTVSFYRKLNTCDDEDIVISDDTLRIIWAYGPDDKVDDVISYHGTEHRGVMSANLLDLQPVKPDLSMYKSWKATSHISLPPNDTIYLCVFHKGPVLEKKHHIVGFSMFAKDAESKKRTHHADLYKCAAPKGSNENEFFGNHLRSTGYNCFFSKEQFPLEHCEIYQFQWAVGGEVTMFPDHVGIPIGESPDEYYMTEVHYDNPEKHEGVQLESGLEVYYTDKLRKHDAGFLRVGVLTLKAYSITIPPMTKDLVVSSHCYGGCTQNLPMDGANVFNYQLHSHLSGRKIKLRHFRGQTELPWFAHDDYYDFNYQNNRDLRVEKKILPGDHLTVECTYNTEWRKGLTTLGGPSTREEMCKTFLLYYPRVDAINNCGSYFPQKAMLDYMGITNITLPKNEIDPTVLAPAQYNGMKYTEAVAKMNWSVEKRAEFQNLIRYGAHDSYCHPIGLSSESEQSPIRVSYPNVAPYVPPSNDMQCPRPAISMLTGSNASSHRHDNTNICWSLLIGLSVIVVSFSGLNM